MKQLFWFLCSVMEDRCKATRHSPGESKDYLLTRWRWFEGRQCEGTAGVVWRLPSVTVS